MEWSQNKKLWLSNEFSLGTKENLFRRVWRIYRVVLG